jgi:hypothetical protein
VLRRKIQIFQNGFSSAKERIITASTPLLEGTVGDLQDFASDQFSRFSH